MSGESGGEDLESGVRARMPSGIEPRFANRRRGGDSLRPLLPALALIVLTFAAHLPALDGWWTTDDPQILLQAIRNSPAETLVSPAAWRSLSTASFTPLVTLSFELDLALFGLRPLFFHQHQIVSIAVVALLLHVLLQPICRPVEAWLIAAAVAVGPPMALVSESLMIRHYVEGMALALGALVLWRSGDPRRTRPLRDSGAALLYLLAMLAKEVFAPLALLFLADAAIRRAPLRVLALRIVPATLAAAVWLAWRTAMLGSAGGYAAGEVALGSGMVRELAESLWASSPAWALAGACLLMLLGWAVGLLRAPREALLLGAAALVVALLPLAAVAGLPEARYAVVPGMIALVLAGLGFSRLRGREAVAATAALLIVHAVAGWALHRSLDRSGAEMTAEGRYVWELPSGAPPLLAGSPGWYLGGLAELRRIAGGGEAPAFFLSRDALVVGAVEPEEVVRMEGEEPVPARLDPAALVYLLDERRRRDDSIPLRIAVERRDHVVRWNLGPEPGELRWLTLPEYDEYEVAPEGSRRVPAAEGAQGFRVRRVLPDGRWTVSPPLELPLEGEVSWTSPGDDGPSRG
ncbi:MAG TPA: hypothetical protein VMS56_10870 [Thermoanaerobaculia bacterium]|nr:hypothetical protein [Thermoanaerobaculia bacterium]